jgi:hypothetical protein
MARRDSGAGDTAVLDTEGNDQPAREWVQEPIGDRPRLIVAGGRGKVGKSVLLRYGIERHLANGGNPVIADCDRTNATLAAFFPAAIRPKSAEDGDVRDWLNTLLDDQAEHQRTIYLDLGGGDLSLHAWARELDLVPFLQENGVTPVLVHCLGSDVDDLAYLRDLERVFAPPHTAIMLNEGMVPANKAPLSAFEPTLDDEVLQAAVRRGAKVVRMPRLGCMQQVEQRRLTFEAASARSSGLGMTTCQMITVWRRQLEQTLAPILPWIS